MGVGAGGGRDAAAGCVGCWWWGVGAPSAAPAAAPAPSPQLLPPPTPLLLAVPASSPAGRLHCRGIRIRCGGGGAVLRDQRLHARQRAQGVRVSRVPPAAACNWAQRGALRRRVLSQRGRWWGARRWRGHWRPHPQWRRQQERRREPGRWGTGRCQGRRSGEGGGQRVLLNHVQPQSPGKNDRHSGRAYDAKIDLPSKTEQP